MHLNLTNKFINEFNIPSEELILRLPSVKLDLMICTVNTDYSRQG